MSAAPLTSPREDAVDAVLLERIGVRLRDARAGRGMTRKLLATRSHVSERYLAQLEGGQANPSVLVLLKIADALGLPITELLQPETDTSSGLNRLVRLLREQTTATLSALHKKLAREFGKAEGQRRGRIALTGLRGAGKSTLGKRLADELDCVFLELDQEIEHRAGTSLSEVFLLYGQGGYRRLERQCLVDLLEAHERCVIATGGSIVTEPGTYDLLATNCLCLWLKAAPEEHMARVLAQGDTRPMAGNAGAMDDLKHILIARTPLYAQADHTVETTGLDLEQSYARLLDALAPTA